MVFGVYNDFLEIFPPLLVSSVLYYFTRIYSNDQMIKLTLNVSVQHVQCHLRPQVMQMYDVGWKAKVFVYLCPSWGRSLGPHRRAVSVKEAWTELKHASRHFLLWFCQAAMLRSSLINGDEGHVSHLYISVYLAPPSLPPCDNFEEREPWTDLHIFFPAIIFACAGDVVRF